MSHNFIVLPVSSISVGKDRQRSMDPSVEAHIKSLRQEISSDGLIHAITVDKNHSLVAGWCRLHAVGGLERPYFYAGAEIAPGFVPCVPTHWEKEGDLFRIELHENLRRKNLSPVDEARAVSRLHKYLQAQQGEGWTKGDTGKELDKTRGVEERSHNVSRDEVGDALLIEQFADDPDVLKAKTRHEASKTAKKLLEKQLSSALGGLQLRKQSEFKVIHGDLAEKMKEFPPNSFQGIVVDPPYGMDADKFGEQTAVGGHAYEDTEDLAISIAGDIFIQGHRITSPDAHLYLFCDIRLFHDLVSMAQLYNWQPFPTPLIWHKPGLGHAPMPGYFGRRYEAILFCQKGNRKLAKSRSDVFEFPAVKDKIHAAQKPVELITELLNLSFFPGEHVLDPCCGSGTIFHAARAAKMKATGIEKNEESYRLSVSAASQQ